MEKEEEGRCNVYDRIKSQIFILVCTATLLYLDNTCIYEKSMMSQDLAIVANTRNTVQCGQTDQRALKKYV